MDVKTNPRIELLTPQQSIERIEKCIELVEKAQVSHDHMIYKKEAGEALKHAFLQSFKAHLAVAKHSLNAPVACDVAWDNNTGFPSHPTLIADAVWWSERTVDGRRRALLNSFGQWSLWAKQKLKGCACGKKLRKSLRNVELEIVLRNDLDLKEDQSTIVMRLIAGVRSNDKDHLYHHYGQDWVRNDEGIIITALAECTIHLKRLEDKIVEIRITRDEGVNEFNRKAFYHSITDLRGP